LKYKKTNNTKNQKYQNKNNILQKQPIYSEDDIIESKDENKYSENELIVNQTS